MKIICPVCESTDITVLGDYRGNHSIFQGLSRVNCKACGMVFASPMPNIDQLITYNAGYFDSAHGGQNKGVVATAFFNGIARLRLEHVSRYINKYGIKASNVLEVGPGPGYFAEKWLNKFPKSFYTAIETDSSCYTALKEIGVHLIEKPTDTPNDDLVVMSHVLEHVSAPKKFITTSTNSLRKGGVLFIEVPCRDWEHKLMDEPHLLFFDKNPMHHLLNELGFEEIQVSYHGIEIEKLRSKKILNKIWDRIRNKLIAFGVVSPFAKVHIGMEVLANPMERATVAPFNAHQESSNPAWWLRALARKK